MTPKEVVEIWVNAFNKGDAEKLQSLYAEDAINHQMPNKAVNGREEIGNMLKSEFAAAPDMHCIQEQIISEGDWAVLEWRDPKGFRGCGFFKVQDGLIRIQRGYWDKLSFRKLYGIEE